MTIITATPVLAPGVRAGSLLRGAAERLGGALTQRATRARDRLTVTNEVAPLILIAVIAVAAALALIATR